VQTMISRSAMRRILLIVGVIAAISIVVEATTLEKMTIDQMAQASTDIVQAKILAQRTEQRNGVIYTRSTLMVLNRWKGTASSSVDVSVPGGKLGGFQQTFPGTPDLQVGTEYVFFLWTGTSGVTQLVGFSQGVFDYQPTTAGQTATVSRAASTATLIAQGKPVAEGPVKMTLAELDQAIRRALGGTATGAGSAKGAPAK
jgi:hypothetical protein